MTLSALTHEFIFSHEEGFLYYGTAAAFDTMLVLITANFKKITRLIVNVQTYCLLSFIVNLAGWVAFMGYSSPAGYDAASMIVFTFAFLILTRNDDGGSFQLDRWARWFRFHAFHHSLPRSPHKK